MMKTSLLVIASAFTLLSSVTLGLQINITALSAHHQRSVLECWQLDAPFTVSTQPGVAGSAIAQLGDVQNMSYILLPSDFDGGIHNAPAVQWVVYTTGFAEITIPGDNSTKAFISGGEFGLIFAADTANVSKTGHRTVYPGISETVALEIPTKDGKVPPHKVVRQSPCTARDTLGLRSLVIGNKGS